MTQRRTLADLRGLSDEDLFALVRTVVAFRLIGLPVKYVAGCIQCNVTVDACKQILRRVGRLPHIGGDRIKWNGRYAISPEMHAWLRFPQYIPLSSEDTSFQIAPQHSMAWMSLIRDNVFVRHADGSLRSWGDGESPPFHKEDGAEYDLPDLNTWGPN